ncbi:ribonuclease H-like domain-containing protein [Tanacetum coccineum]
MHAFSCFVTLHEAAFKAAYPTVNPVYSNPREEKPRLCDFTSPSPTPHALLSVSPSTWHQRLGHLGEDVLRSLKSRQYISYNKEKSSHLCHACQLGKHVKLPFTSSNSIVTRSFEIVHSDIWTSPIASSDAMYDKYNALIKNSNWVLVLKPPTVNVVQSMWLFRHKYHDDRSLSWYKACLVANGHCQQFGVNCDDTFSHVVKPATIHMILSLALSQNWPIHQLDMYQPPFLTATFLRLYICISHQVMRTWHVSVSKDALKLLGKAHMANCNPTRMPVDTKSKLGSDGDLISNPTLYHSLAGSLVAYTDADWVGFPTIMWSTSGYCIFLGDNLLSWSAKRQYTLSRSSVEAEYRGVANIVAETTWLRNLLRELHTPLLSATIVYCNNVRVLHVSSRYQYADIFTKGLPSALFEEFLARVGPLSGKGPRVIVSADVSILPQSAFVRGNATGAALEILTCVFGISGA